MEKFYNLLNRNSLFILYISTAIILLPFLFLSFFNHPASDDYCYTHFVVENGFWPVQFKNYMIWTGRYTATFLLTIDPINLNDLTIYKALPVILFLSFAFSILIFIRSLVPNLSHKNTLIISFLIFFLYLYNTPNMAEAFYWRAGSMTYQLASVLTLLLFASIRNLQEQRSVLKTSILTFLSSVLAVITIGLNETSMIIIFAIVFLWSVGWFLVGKGKKIEMTIILLITITATVIMIVAPGNAVRMAEKPDKFQFLFSIVGALKQTLYRILLWIPMTTLLIALFLSQFNKMGNSLWNRYKLDWIKLWHLTFCGVFFFGLLVLCFFPSLWSQGGLPPFRTINVIYLLFIIGTFFLTSLFFAYLQQKNSPVPKLSKRVQLSLSVVILSILIFKPNNLKTAYSDIFTGTAYRYQLEMQERYQILENCTRKTCIVPALKNKPKTIFSSDLGSNRSEEIYYYNKCIANFFRIPEVIITEKKVPYLTRNPGELSPGSKDEVVRKN